MLSDACHKRNVPLCLYYSIADWNHPNYPNQGRHHELPPQPQDSPDWDKYMVFLKEQVRELCTNYLLNVGPTPEGIIPQEAASILKRIGIWKKSVDESFGQVTADTGLVSIPGVLVTKRDRTLYIHLNKAPVGNGLKLKPIRVLPSKATLLNNGSPIDCVVNLCPSDHATQQPYLRLRNLPANGMADTVLIAKLEFDRPLDQIVLKPGSETNIELTK